MTEARDAARVLVVGDATTLALRELVEAAGARVIGPVAPGEGVEAVVGGGFDAVLADLRRGEPPAALIDALAEHHAAAVLIERAQLDEPTGALVFARGVELLCEADAIACATALRIVLARGRVWQAREESDAERAAGLRRISEEMERLARTLGDLAKAAPPARSGYVAAPAQGFRGSAPKLDAAAIRTLIRARRSREQYLGADLFADPAWDMLLDLMAARLEGTRVSVSSLCIAAAVPSTTALRWVSVLADAGLIVRQGDPQDRRRIFIVLSESGATAMTACLVTAGRGGTLPW